MTKDELIRRLETLRSDAESAASDPRENALLLQQAMDDMEEDLASLVNELKRTT